MILTATSDLHGMLPIVDEVPKSKALLIAGDIVPLQIQRNNKSTKKWLYEIFSEWVAELKKKAVDRVIAIPGNHDFYFESNIDINKLSEDLGVTFLINSYTDIVERGERVSVFGTPQCKRFGNWAFNTDEEEYKNILKALDRRVDILLTHDAPAGICDVDCSLETTKEHYGSQYLTNKLIDLCADRMSPALVICGHIHSGDHHLMEYNKIKFVNVSYCDEHYAPSYPIFKIDTRTI